MGEQLVLPMMVLTILVKGPSSSSGVLGSCCEEEGQEKACHGTSWGPPWPDSRDYGRDRRSKKTRASHGLCCSSALSKVAQGLLSDGSLTAGPNHQQKAHIEET